MKGLLIAASLWILTLAVPVGLVPSAAPCLIPAFRLPAPPASLLRSFRWLERDRDRTDRYDKLISAQAKRRRLDPRLVKAIIAAESGFSPRAVSPAGARGLMQVMPATAREMGVNGNLEDPPVNIEAGTAYLELLHRAAWHRYAIKGRRYSDTPPWLQRRIVAAYNAGPRALTGQRWCRETRQYVEKVSFYHKTEVVRLRAMVETETAAR